MTTSKLFVAAIAMSTALATPAFAQWRSQETLHVRGVGPGHVPVGPNARCVVCAAIARVRIGQPTKIFRT